MHTIELKSRKFNQLYRRLVQLRGVNMCTLCSGKGTVWEKIQSLLPVVALDGSGSECAAATELLTRREVIRQTTVRAAADTESTAGFSRPIDIPVAPPADTADILRGHLKMSKRMTVSLLTEASNSDVHPDDLKGLLEWKGKENEVTDPETVRSIQQFIRTRMGVTGEKKHYANIWVKNVFAVTVVKKDYAKQGQRMINRMVAYTSGEPVEPKKKCHLKNLRIRVQGEGSSFCGNRGEYHETNSVYFEMGPDECWQRCFCTDDTVGTSQRTCQEYSTSARGGRKLSDELMALFKSSPVSGMPGSSISVARVQVPEKKRLWDQKGKTPSKKARKDYEKWDNMSKLFERQKP